MQGLGLYQGRDMGLYQGRDSQLVPRYPGKYPGHY